MKRIAILIGLTAILSVASAQDSTPWYKNIISLVQTNGPTSITAALYPSYAPGLTVGGEKKEWGAGLAIIVPITEHTFAGGRIDWLADDFFAPSLNIGLQLPVTLFNRVKVTPLTYTGMVYPLSDIKGQSQSLGAIAGGGAYATLLTWGNGSLNAFYTYERWSNFEIGVHHVGAAVTFKF